MGPRTPWRARTDARPVPTRQSEPSRRSGSTGRITGLARYVLEGRGLIPRFAYMLATQTLTVVLGLGYWIAGTRLIPTPSFGVAAAATATATLLATFATLGIGSLFLVELGSTPLDERRVLLVSGTVLAAGVGTLLGLGTWLAAPHLGRSLEAVVARPDTAMLFVLGCALLPAVAIFDAGAIGLHRAPVQLWRNVAASAGRVGLLIAAASLGLRSADALLGVWVATNAASLACFPLLRLPPVHGALGSFAARRALVVRFGPVALRHYVLNTAIKAVSLFVPVLAAAFSLPTEFAYFSSAQLIASTALLAPALLAMSLFVETSGDATLLRQHVRRTLLIGFGWSAAMLAVFEPGATLLLGVFGSAYAAHGAEVLRLLVLGGIPYVVKDHYVAIRRAQRELSRAARTMAGATLFEVGGAALGGALGGLDWLCASWVVASTLVACCVAPMVFGMVRSAASDARGVAARRPSPRRALLQLLPSTRPAGSGSATTR